MEGEVSGIAKLGIVLIALAVLIGLGFGIFQISKSTANTGVGNVQSELDGVSASTFTAYDQTTITGTMVTSALADFEGETAAILISNRALTDALNSASADVGTEAQAALAAVASGITQSYGDGSTPANTKGCPIIWAYKKPVGSGEPTVALTGKTSGGTTQDLAFINYNTILGAVKAGATTPAGCTNATFTSGSDAVNMTKMYFDSNCYRSCAAFATGSSGKVLSNNIIGNTSKTGRTEYIPSGAKFESYLIKDNSDTVMGIVLQQVGNN